MSDSDEDVVLAGSALHHHLVSSGYTDIEVHEKEREKTKQPTLADELHNFNGVCCENGNDQPDTSMKK